MAKKTVRNSPGRRKGEAFRCALCSTQNHTGEKKEADTYSCTDRGGWKAHQNCPAPISHGMKVITTLCQHIHLGRQLDVLSKNENLVKHQNINAKYKLLTLIHAHTHIHTHTHTHTHTHSHTHTHTHTHIHTHTHVHIDTLSSSH